MLTTETFLVSMTGSPLARKRWLVVLVLVLVVVLVGGSAVAACGVAVPRGPRFVDEISVVNRSEFDIRVEVSGDGVKGWMNLVTADRSSTTAASDILDQGAVWLFRFGAQGRDGGDLRIPRADLEQAGWVLEIPEDVIERLRRAGAPPTP